MSRLIGGAGEPCCLLFMGIQKYTIQMLLRQCIAGKNQKGAWTGLKVQCAEVQFMPGNISLSPLISWKTQQHNRITAANLLRSRGIWHGLVISNLKTLYFIRNLGHIFQLHGKRVGTAHPGLQREKKKKRWPLMTPTHYLMNDLIKAKASIVRDTMKQKYVPIVQLIKDQLSPRNNPKNSL